MAGQEGDHVDMMALFDHDFWQREVLLHLDVKNSVAFGSCCSRSSSARNPQPSCPPPPVSLALVFLRRCFCVNSTCGTSALLLIS
jgi:hypothetical protein